MRRHVAVACLFCGLLVTAVNAASEADEYGLELDDTLPEEVLPPLEERSHYWFNDLTSESQWAKPGYEYTDPGSGKVYYMDPDTKETSWEKPDSLKWTAVEDIEAKTTYYHNEATGVSQWEKPAMFAWRLVAVEDGDPPREDGDEEL
ncbi:hypothetical protein D9Q98_006648 [Chlorella vulgaris]|uniref:WW domain-containing protein n=1 Tax=Chlorella vulgaris TaxID=3077 RepID=A0A9D4TKW4_CHLVU|nr:hypothetical protein D9Q98_006648 [Chlorella vulgaris]